MTKLPHCPECGKDLEGVDLVGHANSHWDPNIKDAELGPEAQKRKAQLLAGGVD